MGLPNILINFNTQASSAVLRGSRGTVAIMITEAKSGIYKLNDATQIPENLTEANQDYIKKAFLGGANPVKQVIVIATNSVSNGLGEVKKYKYDYLVGQPDISEEDVATIVSFIKSERAEGHKVKAVLPNANADHEGIINFTAKNIVVGEKTYTTAGYCSRIAGLLAGTPLYMSATYYPLKEIQSIERLTESELNTKIDQGEFCLMHDGEKVKVARAVNSLTTLGAAKSADYKSIKIIDTLDLIYSDIKKTCQDSYIGKYPNNYDNKCNLIIAIKSYLEALSHDGLLDEVIEVGIDEVAQKNYIANHGGDINELSELEIKKYNTGTQVFLKGKFKVLNAIEDIEMQFQI